MQALVNFDGRLQLGDGLRQRLLLCVCCCENGTAPRRADRGIADPAESVQAQSVPNPT